MPKLFRISTHICSEIQVLTYFSFQHVEICSYHNRTRKSTSYKVLQHDEICSYHNRVLHLMSLLH